MWVNSKKVIRMVLVSLDGRTVQLIEVVTRMVEDRVKVNTLTFEIRVYRMVNGRMEF